MESTVDKNKIFPAIGIAAVAIGAGIFAAKNPDKVKKIGDSTSSFFKRVGDRVMDTLFGPADTATDSAK